MQTVWTFLVYFWLLGGLRTPRPPPLAYGPVLTCFSKWLLPSSERFYFAAGRYRGEQFVVSWYELFAGFMSLYISSVTVSTYEFIQSCVVLLFVCKFLVQSFHQVLAEVSIQSFHSLHRQLYLINMFFHSDVSGHSCRPTTLLFSKSVCWFTEPSLRITFSYFYLVFSPLSPSVTPGLWFLHTHWSVILPYVQFSTVFFLK